MAKIAILALCSAAFLVARPLAAQQTEVRTGIEQSSSSYSTVGNDHTHTRYDPSLPKESHNPDAKEQKRLRVRWEKATMRYYGFDPQLRDWRWYEGDALHPWRELAIKGKLLILSEDGKATKPVDWLQPAQVVLSRTHRDRPDWRKRHDRKDSAWGDCVVEKDGSFLATFDPARISRPVGRTEKFQVAISLGIKSGHTLTWKNTVPVLPQSVATIDIAGPQPLSPTMQAINGAPSVHERNFNPVMLIRAVNHLHALGKKKALAELREFLKMARESVNAKRDPANIDTSDYQCVFLIVRLLFEPADPKEKLPHMYIGAMIPSPDKKDEALWPLFPLVVEDDISFILIEGVNLGGHPEHPSSHVDWAEKHGKLRAKPLRPSDDPLGVAEKVVALPQTARLDSGWLLKRGLLRRESWRMIDHLAKRPAKTEDFWSHRNYDADADWQEHKRIAAKLKIRWDEKRQEYVAGK